MSKSTLLQFGRDTQGYNAFAPSPSTNLYSATLVNGSAASITIPSNYAEWVISFSIDPGNSIFVDFTGATAQIPAGATFSATTSELNPGARKIPAFREDGTSTTVSVITDNASTDVGIALYAI